MRDVSELERRIIAELGRAGLLDCAAAELALLMARTVVTAETARESNSAASALMRLMAQLGILRPITDDESDPLTLHLRAEDGVLDGR
jgi:hypothetical protein